MQNFDVIVVGCGGLGAVVTHDLAVSGAKVLGLDRHPPGHALGSSHGQTRAIRKAYFEHPDYVPILLRSYQRWQELEKKSGEDLLTLCGVLEVGPKDGIVVPGVLRAAAEHQLAVESLDAHTLRTRFPQLGGIDDAMAGVFEPDGGYLMVERSVRAWAKQAEANGAQFEWGVSVTGYSHEGPHWRVITDQGDRFCQRLVLCPGPWAPRLLPASLSQKLRVLRKPLFWYQAPSSYARSTGFPVWLFETPEGIFYGFPTIDSQGLKAAQHSGGSTVDHATHVDRSLRAEDERVLGAFLRQHLPGVAAKRSANHSVCMYTMTPDEHFLVGSMKDHQHLYIGAGLSGHGFKLVPALGEALAATVLGERPKLRLDLFAANRFD